jgi:hypothetical protein
MTGVFDQEAYDRQLLAEIRGRCRALLRQLDELAQLAADVDEQQLDYSVEQALRGIGRARWLADRLLEKKESRC